MQANDIQLKRGEATNVGGKFVTFVQTRQVNEGGRGAEEVCVLRIGNKPPPRPEPPPEETPPEA